MVRVTVTTDELTEHVMDSDIEDLIKPMKCEFTTIIHSKGWTVWEACERWGIRYDVWRRTCRNIQDKHKQQLRDRCAGLEDKL
tara:strand:+ start:157 stop:405 length:249 start_codon:yes stop_codon:yes gene_type:complete